MRTRTRTAALAAGFVLLAACADRATTSSPLAPSLSVSANSGCYAVAFHFKIDPVPDGWSYIAVLTGDLVGTAAVDFDPNSVTFAGITLANNGTQTWNVSGGVLPAPVTFRTSFDNRNFFSDRAGSPAGTVENIGTHRVLSGVRVANLSYHGAFTSDPAPQVNEDYRGVICP